MKTLKLVFTSLALFLYLSSDAQKDSQAKWHYSASDRRIITVTASLQYISDINFVKQEYKMELWLKFEVLKEDSCALSDIETQIAIKEAKEIEIDTIPNWRESLIKCGKKIPNSDSTRTRTLRIRSTMIQDWDVSGYPFDKQSLDITVYNPQRSTKWIILSSKDSLLHYYDPRLKIEKKDTLITIENGWSFENNSAHVVLLDSLLNDPFKDSDRIKQYSAIHYVIQMQRLNKWFLFAKLLVGMYVAFIVAYIAMFINMGEAEVRFSLPVGGLFAAIANKYIIESILPQSPDFTMVDKLHSVTIIFIMIIIGYSAWVLGSIKKAKDKGTTPKLTSGKKVAFGFAIVYLLFNIFLVVMAIQESK